MITKHLAIRTSRLRENFQSMRDEKQTWPRSSLTRSPIIERRDDRLSGARCCNHEIAPAAMLSLGRQLLQHFPLIVLRREIEECRRRGHCITRLSSQRSRQFLTMPDNVRIVLLKLAVVPKRLEMGVCPSE